MKKLALFALLLSLTVATIGCGGGETESTGTESGGTEAGSGEESGTESE